MMQTFRPYPAEKIIGLDQFIHAILPELKTSGRKTVFTNGCFDILHAGHVTYLDQAARLGDILVLGLNTDASVRRLKGPERPITAQQDRALVIASLACVDYVIFFDEDTPRELICAILPDILVKGGDYQPEKIVGAPEVRSAGGRVEVLPFVEGHSTTALVEKLKKL